MIATPETDALLQHAHRLMRIAEEMGVGADISEMGELGALVAHDSDLTLYDDGNYLVMIDSDDWALRLPWRHAAQGQKK